MYLFITQRVNFKCLKHQLIFLHSLGVKLYKNELIDISYTVINAGSQKQDIDVKIEDDKKFAQVPVVVSYTIAAGANKTGKFQIKGGLIVGETT